MLAEVIMAALILVPPGVAAVMFVVGLVKAAREILRVRALVAAVATPAAVAAGRVVVRGRARAVGGAAPETGLLYHEWGRVAAVPFVVEDATGAVQIDLGASLFGDLAPRGRVVSEGDEVVVEGDVARAEANYRQAASAVLRPSGRRAVVVPRDVSGAWLTVPGAVVRGLVWMALLYCIEAVLGGFVFAITGWI